MERQSVLPSIVLVAILAISMLGFQFWTSHSVEAQETSLKVVNPLTGDTSFNFTDAEKSVGDTFVANITIVDVTDLCTWQIRLSWDASLLGFVSLVFPSDDVFYDLSPIRAPTDSSVLGTVLGGAAAGPSTGTFNGTGTCCQITLRIIQPAGAHCNLNFANVGIDTWLLDSQGVDIPFTVVNGFYDYRNVLPTSLKIVDPLTGDGWFNFNALQKKVGDTFVINITVVAVHGLGGVWFTLTWNASLLDFVSINIPTDNIFAGRIACLLGLGSGPGHVGYIYQLVGPLNGVDGSGTVCQITMRIAQNVSSSIPEVSCDLAFANPYVDTFLFDYRGGMMISVLVSGSYGYRYVPQLEADEYTLALWHFNEGSGQTVYDSSSHGNNGTFGSEREPSWVAGVTGEPGDYALSMDDWYDYVLVPDNPDNSLDLNLSNQFTIEFYAYVKQISRDGYHWNYFMSKNQGTQTGWGICQSESFPMISAYFWYNSTDNFQNGPNPPELNKWVHIMFVYDGHFLYTFYDDVLQDRKDVGSHFVADNNQPLTIGKDLGDDVPWDDSVNCIIDEVRISSIARLHDVSVTDIAPSKTVVGQGYSMGINVTVANRGIFTENFNVTGRANDTVFETQTVNNMIMNTSALMTFEWNTTGFAYGNYTLVNCADLILGEANPGDNNCTCMIPVHVGVPGDISGPTIGVYDGTCNMRDITYLIIYFNTRPTSPNWKPNADINNDGTVNMRDITIAILNFNKHE